MKPSKVFNILIVEDSAPDQDLIAEFFRMCGIPNEVHIVSDGKQASDFIFKRDKFADKLTPDLIVMDMNLPIKTGKEVLVEVRQDPTLGRIPIVIITTSTNLKEVNEVYRAGANAFIPKSTDIDSFQFTINTLAAFWFKCAVLPSGS